MISVYSERPIANGKVRRRYEVTLTDNQSNIHTKVLGMYNHDPSDDGSQVESDYLASLEEQEAEQASEEDTGIDLGTFASINLKALAYLRRAYSLDDPYQAYIRYDKFNDYRISKGWSLTQVVAGLADVGLTQEEWDLILARYTYLSNAQRVTAMENYQLVLASDPKGGE